MTSPAPQVPMARVWRAGDELVMDHDAVLPARCIHCNAPVEQGPREYRLHYHPPWLLFVCILLGITVLGMLSAIMLSRKSADVHLALCQRHQRRRTWVVILALAAFLGVVTSCVLTWNILNPHIIVGHMIAAVIVPVVILQFRGAAAVKKIDRELIWIRVGKPFLESFPAHGYVLVPFPWSYEGLQQSTYY